MGPGLAGRLAGALPGGVGVRQPRTLLPSRLHSPWGALAVPLSSVGGGLIVPHLTPLLGGARGRVGETLPGLPA